MLRGGLASFTQESGLRVDLSLCLGQFLVSNMAAARAVWSAWWHETLIVSQRIVCIRPALEVLTTRIPDDLLKAIQEIEKEERAERAEVVRKLLDRAIRDWRVAKALRMIQEGRWTVRRAAKFSGLTYHEILDRMTELGIDSGPTLKELREGFDRR